MRIEGRHKSSDFEDRGTGGGGGSRGGVPIQALTSIVSLLGVKGTLIVGGLLAVALFVMPAGLRQELLVALMGGDQGAPSAPGAGSVCQASEVNGAACDFSRVVLASTEDVWTPLFDRGALPSYGTPPGSYRHPTLVVFAGSVSTGGCGNATSGVGPFYRSEERRVGKECKSRWTSTK